jgi:hypothetical protein
MNDSYHRMVVLWFYNDMSDIKPNDTTKVVSVLKQQNNLNSTWSDSGGEKMIEQGEEILFGRQKEKIQS